MFRNRALTFSERLGWDVKVRDGYERDVFDDANPLYLVSVDPRTHEYWGSLRLLPTTGPNMLRDVFPYLLDEGEYIESATIWESSRICAVAIDGQPQRSRNGVNFVLSELIAGIGEVADLRRPHPDRLGVRRADLPRPQSGRLQSAAHRQASQNWRHNVLRRAVRYGRRSFAGSAGVPRGTRHRGRRRRRKNSLSHSRLLHGRRRRARGDADSPIGAQSIARLRQAGSPLRAGFGGRRGEARVSRPTGA